MIHVNRLSIALICYGVLGALAWTTLPDPRFRAGTLAILVFLAVKSVLRRNEVLHPDKDAEWVEPAGEIPSAVCEGSRELKADS
jgi:hypothetical protein